MQDKTVIITGAGSGLGASLARKFSQMGNHVCLLGRTRSKLESTASKLKHGHSIFEVDITSRDSVRTVMQKITEEIGSIDYLVNNAGAGIFKMADDLTENEVHRMIDTNLKGTIFCTQEVLGPMKENNGGYIVNIVSASGKTAKVTESVYSASKFGVRGFFEAVALEAEGSGIQILSAFMGNMKTGLWNEVDTDDTYMDPDDVADIILDNLKTRRHTMVTDVTILNQ